MTELSIVILTCNQAAYTMRLLRPLAAWLRGNTAAEVILVDNGSTDDTASLVRKWARSEGTANFRLIEAGENLGVARGRNLGLKAARGDVLMLLDNDTLAAPEVYEALARHVAEREECGVAAPALYSPEGELQASAKPYPSPLIKLAHVLRPGRELRRERRELRKRHPYYVIGACQTFRREVLQRAGMLDATIFFGPEDCDFCMRVRRAGYTIDYLPELRLTHDWHRSTRRNPLGRLGRRHATALLRFWLKGIFHLKEKS